MKTIYSAWIQSDYREFHCKNCGCVVNYPKLYCPECNAYMKNENEGELK